ncbi:hypothetical protein [Flavobacterium sp. 3HN19-14]|uniref:hypothetical protein n=1 Tax=Flavobacterium sp. 3HN19-14 TaxID=3448133 RepID=UPI003EDF7979
MQMQNTTFIVQSLHPDQLFVEEGADVYEGVGQVWAFFGNSNTVSTGKAWIEQNLGK